MTSEQFLEEYFAQIGKDPIVCTYQHIIDVLQDEKKQKCVEIKNKIAYDNNLELIEIVN